MLQILIDHCGDNGKEITILSIKDEGKTLAKFNPIEKKIDLDVCIPYVGQDIIIHHVYPNVSDCYVIVATLKEIATDENGIKYISYIRKYTKENAVESDEKENSEDEDYYKDDIYQGEYAKYIRS